MQQKDSGGFDRRTLLAFALMILVLVISQRFMPSRKRPEPTPEQQTVEAAETPDVGRPRPSAPPITPGEWQASGSVSLANLLPAEERRIEVAGERFTAIFTTRGAALASWQLLEFTDASEELVDLVQDQPGALTLKLQGPAGIMDLSETIFSVEESRAASGERILRFFAETAPGDTGEPIRIERIYRIDPTRFDMEMEVSVAGIANHRREKNCVIEWARGIPNLETQESLEKAGKAAVALLAEDLVKDALGGGMGMGGSGCGCAGQGARAGEHEHQGTVRWAGVRGKYFTGIIIPEEDTPATFVSIIEPEEMIAGMRLVLPMEAEGPSLYRFTVYAGPLDFEPLKDLDNRLDRSTTKLVDFGFKLIRPISMGVYWFLSKVHSVVPNYGLVIIILSILVRLVFHPLNVKALQSQQRLRALQPELKELNEKYKDNAEMRSKKMMELHRKHGVNPVGGCLPLAAQMPVLFALYPVLMNSIDLRKEPFVWWIKDLAAPDQVAEIAGFPINLLPILMALTMLWQQKLTPTDPKQAPMMMMMPIMMVFFFYSLPSGLVLYWTVMNVMAIAQQMMMKPATLAPNGPSEPAPKSQKK